MKRRYTITHRIDDIIALIQILAYSGNAQRTEEGLKKDLGAPRSVESGQWRDVASSHLEFFRYSDGESYPFSLVARYTMPSTVNNKREPIPNDLVKELLNLTVLLHDKEVRRRENWKIWLPPILAGLPGLIAIFLTFL